MCKEQYGICAIGSYTCIRLSPLCYGLCALGFGKCFLHIHLCKARRLSPLCFNSCVRNNVDSVLFVSGDACYKSQETESTLFLCICKDNVDLVLLACGDPSYTCISSSNIWSGVFRL